jgi:hypothetical protein
MNVQCTLIAIVALLSSTLASAQFTQTVRGVLSDVLLQTPLAGATVTMAGKSVTTDEAGVFKFSQVPVGSYSIKVSHIAYNDVTLDNIVVNTGKETVLNIPIDMKVTAEDEVVVKSAGKKNKPLNDMSVVSARAFTVEETQKYAAAVNDPLRMATGFPGVMSADDGGNAIVIRGNAPTGLLWRMEGIDIPNPNHFSDAGSSGGGISILSTQLLANSDFITGAFAAEYGNGLSGVFDLKLRRGNNEKREYTLQAGVLGLNVAAEGPFSPFYKGSYLINYRYSTLELLSKMGLELGEGASNFQDLSYNIYLPTRRAGTFTLFGFTGLSSQNDKPAIDSNKWEGEEDRYSDKFISNTIMNGITHNISLGNRTSLRSAIGYSSVTNRYHERYVEEDGLISDSYRNTHKTNKLTVSSTFNHKFNRRNALRAGVMGAMIGVDYFQLSRDNPNEPLEETINTDGKMQTVQAFTQWQHKFSDRLSFNSGIHYLRLLYNNTSSIEPRASVKWDLNRTNSLALGYGLHSQLQAYGVYFAKQQNPGGMESFPNKDLDLTRSHHLVLSFGHTFSKNLRLRTEVYYQHLFDVPVSTSDTNTFSVLNIQDEFVTDPLVNNGKGRNYGIEVSLERYLSDNFYYTLSSSFYQSKYTAADGIERNTRFNGGFVNSIIAGKEFITENKRKTFGINLKILYAGGYRTTPINVERSAQNGTTEFYDKAAFSQQNPNYFRTDLRLSMKWNRHNRTNTLSLDIQNLSNRQNVYDQYFDPWLKDVKTSHQNGLIPILNYKVEF